MIKMVDDIEDFQVKFAQFVADLNELAEPRKSQLDGALSDWMSGYTKGRDRSRSDLKNVLKKYNVWLQDQ